MKFRESPVVPFVRTVLVLDASCHSDETRRHREQKWWVPIKGVTKYLASFWGEFLLVQETEKF